MSEAFDKEHTREDVKVSLFQMAPRVDSFMAGALQRYCSLLHEDIVSVVLDLLKGGELPTGLNATSITLIPKVQHPQHISQYRPISQCSVLHKIASKCIANRARVFFEGN
jgi:hypothetical protein